jgi:hypothetical protein
MQTFVVATRKSMMVSPSQAPGNGLTSAISSRLSSSARIFEAGAELGHRPLYQP